MLWAQFVCMHNSALARLIHWINLKLWAISSFSCYNSHYLALSESVYALSVRYRKLQKNLEEQWKVQILLLLKHDSFKDKLEIGVIVFSTPADLLY